MSSLMCVLNYHKPSNFRSVVHNTSIGTLEGQQSSPDRLLLLGRAGVEVLEAWDSSTAKH